MKILVASNNRDKLAEIKTIFGASCDVVSLRDLGLVSEPEETGTTFAENALIKARAALALSGLPTLADDSGLCVEALGGAPGVYSARFAGEPCDNEKNNDLLLAKMKGVSDRRAAYVCHVCLAFPDGNVLHAEGRCEGLISTERHGTGGFGYDPLFYVPELGKTFGDATAEEKNALSHRAKALWALQKEWKTYDK